MSLGDVIEDALKLAVELKAKGLGPSEIQAALEKTVRDVWPFTREWHYLCADCDDVGLIMGECDGGSRCGRHKAHLPHAFGSPCWCKAGAKYREKPPSDPADFKAAGKSKPMSRMGR